MHKIYTSQPDILKSHIVSIEVDISKGLHSFSIVGLAGKAVGEAKDRVSAAIKNSGWISPKSKNQKIIVSLAPADLKKEGTGFDLSIALAYLLASNEITFDPKNKIFIGELSLDGHLEPVNGVLPMIIEAKRKGFTECFVPKDNSKEAALIEGMIVYGVENLKEIVQHLNTKIKDDKEKIIKIKTTEKTVISKSNNNNEIDISDIKGQFSAKRALQIACAGGHNIILFGPPGTGKTMLAKASSGILPQLSFEEILEVTSIHSLFGEKELITNPPFRSPHHTASYVSIIGGGTNPKPGEATLAHRGILFLDEMPEFSTQVLETLREPLEEGKVRISRAKSSVIYPAQFMLIGAMNPCPCGNFGVPGKECRCAPLALEKYRRKLSGPISDRIDIWVEVSKIEHSNLADGKKSGENSKKIAENINKAREIQKKRYKNEKISLNSQLTSKHLNSIIKLSDNCKDILNKAAQKMDLSARSYHRLIKTARTIADLEGDTHIKPTHIAEALQYRPKIYN